MIGLHNQIHALTKLSWNTADFSRGLPIRTGFGSNVGKTLREFDGREGYEPRSEYKFYM